MVNDVLKYVIKLKADTFNLIAGRYIYLTVCNVSSKMCRIMKSSKRYLNIFDRLVIHEMFTTIVLTFIVQDI